MERDESIPSAARILQKQMESLQAVSRAFDPSLRMFEPIHLPPNVNPAEWTYKRLAEYIDSFEKRLDENHEIGARLVCFGQSVVFHIDDIGYYGPDIITFHGKNDRGEAVQLVQNISQLSVLLVAVARRGDTAKRIGFRLLADRASDDKA